jgi:hypothetical protein
MNYNQQFDEHIKEQFNNYSPDVHPRIWENIIAKTDTRKPVGFWMSFFNNKNKLLFLGLLIAIGTAGTWLYMNTGFSSLNKEIAGESNTAPAKKQTELAKNNLPRNNNNSLDQTGAVSVLNEEAANNTFINIDPSVSVPGGTKASIYTPAISLNEELNGVANNNTGTAQHPADKKRNTGLGSVLIINTQSPESAEDDFAGQGTLLGRLTFDAQLYSTKQRTKKQLPLSFNPIIFLPDCPSLEKDAAGNKRYIEFYAGPDYAFRSLRDTGNSIYLQKRKESTEFKSAYSAGVRYTKVFNNSMSVRGGVNYSQINEKFTFKQGNLVQITYIIDANGDTTGSYITTGTRYKTTINRYRSIDVPVVVGYEIGNGKWHANINAGAVINIYSWQNGEVLDTALNPVNITTGKSSSPYQFKTNAGVGFIGAVSVYYKLNDRLHVLAEPYFRYNFAPMNKENITLKQKYQTAGLRLGIRLDLK